MARNFKWSDLDKESASDMIGAGVAYWARPLMPEEWAVAEKAHPTHTDGIVEVEPSNDTGFGLLTWNANMLPRMFLKAYKWLEENAPHSYILPYMAECVADGDAGMFDSDTGDVVAQIWFLGEIVYG